VRPRSPPQQPAFARIRAPFAHVAGTLSAKKADGTTRVLQPRSQVGSGDTLSTEKDSHAQINFSDGAQVTMKPSSAFRVDNFGFSKEAPKEDSFLTTVLQGGLRMVTGLVGSRSPQQVPDGHDDRDNRHPGHDVQHA
jgi:hypothetical protein